MDVVKITKFDSKHVSKRGRIDEKIAAEISCERNYKKQVENADWFVEATNTVVLPRDENPNESEKLYFSDPSTKDDFCARDFPEVYRCENVKTSGFRRGKVGMKQCVQEARCISCKEATGFPAGLPEGSVGGFRIQVGKNNGHLEKKAQVVDKFQETITESYNLYTDCRPKKK